MNEFYSQTQLPFIQNNLGTTMRLKVQNCENTYFRILIYTPQNNWRTNAINYNIDAFCVERILKTDITI